VAKYFNERATLWHQKINHLNMASLMKLEKMVNGMNLKETPLHHVCEACIEGKHQRTSFLKDQATRVLEILFVYNSNVDECVKHSSKG